MSKWSVTGSQSRCLMPHTAAQFLSPCVSPRRHILRSRVNSGEGSRRVSAWRLQGSDLIVFVICRSVPRGRTRAVVAVSACVFAAVSYSKHTH